MRIGNYRAVGRIAGIIVVTFQLVAPSRAAEPEATARAIYEMAGVSGGLVVHLGCGDGRLTAELSKGDGCLVQGLDRDAADVSAARAYLESRGLYGDVTARRWSGSRLPYIDNAVNLLVAQERADFPVEELMRVLVPRGVALIHDEEAWRKVVKPWPESIDQWTHYMHDATNNAVAHDTAIAPLRHLQWDAPPRYSRHHEFTSSVAAMVSAGGRIFSIMDMGSRASIHMEPKWRLSARDAFNGVLLWERPIESWFNHLWPLKDGPAQPPRRLVAVGDSVYVTLGLEAPVSRLDAATGEVLMTYEGTEFTEEILYADGQLILLKNTESMNPADYFPRMMVCWDEKKRTEQASEGYLLTPDPRRIVVLDATTGRHVWEYESGVEPLTLTADTEHVYFHDWNRIVCLDRETGQKAWESEPLASRDTMGYVYGPTLIAYEDVVLFADGRRERKIHAVSKADGELLWQAPHYAAGHAGSAEDLMVVDGLVWCGLIAGGKHSGVFTGRDPNTGEVIREFTPDVDTYWFHHRCHRSKATDNFILTSRTGIEFVDVREQTWQTHHWVRGACTYGIMPCNGLVYAPPHPCACYLESKLSGFCALAPAAQRSFETPVPPENRLVRGPAFGKVAPVAGAAPEAADPGATDPEAADPGATDPEAAADWPTYRHDTARSGSTKAAVSLPLATQWRTELSGELTAPVVARGRLFVAQKDAHKLLVLDAKTGDPIWSFTADGRIDSPPTIDRGRVIFGSADGNVYCLRATDGALVWRFAAAARDAQLVSYGQLESVWPVHGSVLVLDGAAYFVAGRSTMLDGGLRFYRLDAATGSVLTEKVFEDHKNPQEGVRVLNMPTALTDILSTDGRRLYMMSQVFDLTGKRLETIDPTTEPLERATLQMGEDAHLFSPTGFLDDTAWHRSYWVFGRAFSSGCNWWFRNGRYAPAGRMLVFDDDRVYGFGREPGLFVWSHVLENHLFCSARQASAESIASVKQWSNRSGRDAVFNRRFTRATPTEKQLAPGLDWSVKHPPLHVRALVLAGDTLLAAGPPDFLDEDAAFTSPFNNGIREQKAAQDAAYQGQRGAKLLAVSATNGRTLSEVEMNAPPVWDGMAAANGRLFLVTTDGAVVCLGGE